MSEETKSITTSPNNKPELNKEAVALYATGILPAYVPGLHLFNYASENLNSSLSETTTTPTTLSSMANLKSSFEEWRTNKEQKPTSSPSKLTSTELSMDIFEGSLCHVIGSLEQDVFQDQNKNKYNNEVVTSSNTNSDVLSVSSSSIASSPPCSLSDRISFLLERVKKFPTGKTNTLSYNLYLAFEKKKSYLSPVFRDAVAFWKNAISVWLFDSLLSPSWQDFLERVEEALSTSIADVHSAIVKLSGNFGNISNYSTQQEYGEEKDNTIKLSKQQKSRFEYVPPPLDATEFMHPYPSPSLDVNNNRHNHHECPRTLPRVASVTNIFKDFGQSGNNGVIQSKPSLSSLLTEDKTKTDFFFDKEREESQSSSRQLKPSVSPSYITPSVLSKGGNSTFDPDWHAKCTEGSNSLSSLHSNISSGIKTLETLGTLNENNSNTSSNPERKEKESLAAELGFEVLD